MATKSTSSPVPSRPSASLLTPADFSPDQIKAILEIQRLEKMSLWAKPGSGKTSVALTALEGLYCGRTLIVGTKRIIELVWRQEAVLWSHLKDLTFETISGTPAQRQKKVSESTAKYHLINYELLPWLVDTFKEAWPYDAVLYDEVSKMKVPGTSRFKKMRLVQKKMPVRIGMTGTPRGNSILGLWGQTFVTAGPVLADTMSDYKARWFYPVDDKRLIWRPVAGAETVIKEIVAPYVHAMPDSKTTNDAILVPVAVELPADARRIYDELDTELTVDIKGLTITGTNEMLMRGKQLQLASGAIYHADGKTWTHIHDAKLDALEEVLEDLDDEQVLVFYRFKHELERIKARWKGTLGVNDIERWLKGQGTILALHPASGGHGLSLHTGGCCTQVWFTLPDSSELFTQGNHRLARKGQKRDVRAHVLTVANSREERLVRYLAGLSRQQNHMIEDVRGS